MYSDYSRFHQHPANVLIHLFAVPLFVASLLLGAWLLLSGNAGSAYVALVGIAVSMGAQGIGHRLEAVPPEPFTGPRDMAGRILAEQFYKFWVYLLSGEGLRGMRGQRGG